MWFTNHVISSLSPSSFPLLEFNLVVVDLLGIFVVIFSIPVRLTLRCFSSVVWFSTFGAALVLASAVVSSTIHLMVLVPVTVHISLGSSTHVLVFFWTSIHGCTSLVIFISLVSCTPIVVPFIFLSIFLDSILDVLETFGLYFILIFGLWLILGFFSVASSLTWF